jgi:hypothetical protein
MKEKQASEHINFLHSFKAPWEPLNRCFGASWYDFLQHAFSLSQVILQSPAS